jgi:hypothetical protein
MGTTITLDKRCYKAAADKARQMGRAPANFIESVIDAATLSFDEILAPVRKGFAKSGVAEQELGQAVNEARNAIHTGGPPEIAQVNPSAQRPRGVRLQCAGPGDRQCIVRPEEPTDFWSRA